MVYDSIELNNINYYTSTTGTNTTFWHTLDYKVLNGNKKLATNLH